jgi:hypothetical protein
VVLAPGGGTVRRQIALQYNPDTLSRSYQVQGTGGDGSAGARAQPFRLKGPAIETIKLDAEIDAADQLEFPDQNQTTTQLGIFPQLAALETIVYPASADLQASNALAQTGTIEIAPVEAPLTLFIWSKTRTLPVRITEFGITEEAFDAALNPIRAKVSLGMRVLTPNDLGFDHRGGNLFMTYLRGKEQLARLSQGTPLSTLGIAGIP